MLRGLHGRTSFKQRIKILGQRHITVPLTTNKQTRLLTSVTLIETSGSSLSIFNTVNTATKRKACVFSRRREPVEQEYKTANHRLVSETPFKSYFASGPIVARDGIKLIYKRNVRLASFPLNTQTQGIKQVRSHETLHSYRDKYIVRNISI